VNTRAILKKSGNAVSIVLILFVVGLLLYSSQKHIVESVGINMPAKLKYNTLEGSLDVSLSAPLSNVTVEIDLNGTKKSLPIEVFGINFTDLGYQDQSHDGYGYGYSNEISLNLSLFNLSVLRDGQYKLDVRFILAGEIIYNTSTLLDIQINKPPILLMNIPDQELIINGIGKINISNYYDDPDFDELAFGAVESENFTFMFSNGIATVLPKYNYTGSSILHFYAKDHLNTTYSNAVSIEVFSLNMSENLTQLDAEVGKPVKWIKEITYNTTRNTTTTVNQSFSVQIPIEADNISLIEFEDEKSKDVLVDVSLRVTQSSSAKDTIKPEEEIDIAATGIDAHLTKEPATQAQEINEKTIEFTSEINNSKKFNLKQSRKTRLNARG
jgi:hypothetical protein